MDGQRGGPPSGEDAPAAVGVIDQFLARISAGQPTRLAQTVGALASRLHSLVRELGVTPAELRAMVEFLTEVGHHTDAHRQEWVLLADVLGLSATVQAVATPTPPGATPQTVPGPFYRPDAPDLPAGADICRDGKGQPLLVRGRVLSLNGGPVVQAVVEVWQANGDGRYENQEPDRQPENNLRGRFRTDAQGRFWFRSIMPKGYGLPADGPVGTLVRALGLGAERPAHLHFRVSAPGHERLTTHIFDRADPAISADALFGVVPELLADFRPPDGIGGARSLELDLVLRPTGAAPL